MFAWGYVLLLTSVKPQSMLVSENRPGSAGMLKPLDVTHVREHAAHRTNIVPTLYHILAHVSPVTQRVVSPRLGPRSEALFGLVREFGRGGVLGEIRAMLRSAGVPPACRPEAGGPR